MAMASITIPPPHGFRFRPPEKELISHYLIQKNFGDDPDVDQYVPTVDLSKFDPWEIPEVLKQYMPWEDEAWHIFGLREALHGKGNHYKRKTKSGFWKSTCEEEEIIDDDCVGKKRILVFHNGPYPGKRTDWVIYEYALSNPLPDQIASYVICCLKKTKKKTNTKSKSKKAKKEDDIAKNKLSSYVAPDLAIPKPPPVESSYESFSQPSFPYCDEDGSSCNITSNYETPPTANSVVDDNDMFIPLLPSPEGQKDIPIRNEFAESEASIEELLSFFVPDEKICGNSLDGIFDESSSLMSSELSRILDDLVSRDKDSGEISRGSGPLAPSSY